MRTEIVVNLITSDSQRAMVQNFDAMICSVILKDGIPALYYLSWHFPSESSGSFQQSFADSQLGSGHEDGRERARQDLFKQGFDKNDPDEEQSCTQFLIAADPEEMDMDEVMMLLKSYYPMQFC